MPNAAYPLFESRPTPLRAAFTRPNHHDCPRRSQSDELLDVERFQQTETEQFRPQIDTPIRLDDFFQTTERSM